MCVFVLLLGWGVGWWVRFCDFFCAGGVVWWGVCSGVVMMGSFFGGVRRRRGFCLMEMNETQALCDFLMEKFIL